MLCMARKGLVWYNASYLQPKGTYIVQPQSGYISYNIFAIRYYSQNTSNKFANHSTLSTPTGSKHKF